MFLVYYHMQPTKYVGREARGVEGEGGGRKS